MLRNVAPFLFFAQLALNAARSWMFFAALSQFLGLPKIVPQFLVILVAIAVFHRLDAIAAWCLAPLATWLAMPA